MPEPTTASSALAGSTPTSARTSSRPTTSKALRSSQQLQRRRRRQLPSAFEPEPDVGEGLVGRDLGVRYYSGTKEACSFLPTPANVAAGLVRCSLPDYAAPDTGGTITPMNELGSNTFHDVQVRWNAPWNATVSIGANNVFEHYAAPAVQPAGLGLLVLRRFRHRSLLVPEVPAALLIGCKATGNTTTAPQGAVVFCGRACAVPAGGDRAGRAGCTIAADLVSGSAMKLQVPFIQLPLAFDADVLAAEIAALGEGAVAAASAGLSRQFDAAAGGRRRRPGQRSLRRRDAADRRYCSAAPT